MAIDGLRIEANTVHVVTSFCHSFDHDFRKFLFLNWVVFGLQVSNLKTANLKSACNLKTAGREQLKFGHNVEVGESFMRTKFLCNHGVLNATNLIMMILKRKLGECPTLNRFSRVNTKIDKKTLRYLGKHAIGCFSELKPVPTTFPEQRRSKSHSIDSNETWCETEKCLIFVD